jgi:hypothetical protein
MKKLFSLVAVLVFSAPSYAESEKVSWCLGGVDPAARDICDCLDTGKCTCGGDCQCTYCSIVALPSQRWVEGEDVGGGWYHSSKNGDWLYSFSEGWKSLSQMQAETQILRQQVASPVVRQVAACSH